MRAVRIHTLRDSFTHLNFPFVHSFIVAARFPRKFLCLSVGRSVGPEGSGGIKGTGETCIREGNHHREKGCIYHDTSDALGSWFGSLIWRFRQTAVSRSGGWLYSLLKSLPCRDLLLVCFVITSV